MSKVNTSRVLVGGLAAGFVMNVVDFVVNAVLLAARWQRETEALNPTIMAKAQVTSSIGWVTVDFILGIITVWLYAAIRPRFGPGPSTGLLAAVVVWLIAHAAYSSYAFMSLYSAGLIAASTAGGLVAAIAGGYVGAMLYRE